MFMIKLETVGTVYIYTHTSNIINYIMKLHRERLGISEN